MCGCSHAQASVFAARGLSSDSGQVQLVCGTWDLPGPETEPVSVALQGEFLNTGPPEKPLGHSL